MTMKMTGWFQVLLSCFLPSANRQFITAFSLVGNQKSWETLTRGNINYHTAAHKSCSLCANEVVFVHTPDRMGPLSITALLAEQVYPCGFRSLCASFSIADSPKAHVR